MSKQTKNKKTTEHRESAKDPFYDFESHGRWWEQGNSNFQEMLGTPNNLYSG